MSGDCALPFFTNFDCFFLVSEIDHTLKTITIGLLLIVEGSIHQTTLNDYNHEIETWNLLTHVMEILNVHEQTFIVRNISSLWPLILHITIFPGSVMTDLRYQFARHKCDKKSLKLTHTLYAWNIEYQFQ